MDSMIYEILAEFLAENQQQLTEFIEDNYGPESEGDGEAHHQYGKETSTY